MRNAFTLARKDIRSYLNSWTGVLICFFFYILAGTFFCFLTLSYSKLSFTAAQNAYQGVQGLGITRFIFSSFFINLAALLMFLIPILSMRVFSEERKMQTLELLYTYPFSDFEVVWGKFLGMAWFFLLLCIPIFFYIGMIHYLGGTVDWGPIAIGFLGFWLLGNAYLSLGLFISSLTDSQVLSAMLTFVCLILFWILDWSSGLAGGSWAHFLAALSPLHHYREFSLGVLDLSNVVYFFFFHFYFLFLTLRSIETRNWKG